MARAPRVASPPASTAAAPSLPVTIVAYEDGAAQPVDPAAAAPIGWRITAVCALVALIDRIESTLVAGVLPDLQADLGFSDSAAGAIPTAAALAGLILVIPAGRLADGRRRTSILAVVVAAWSVFTLGSALATGFAMFFGVRMLLGSAGQLDNPPAASLIADAHPGRGRAKAYGIERMAYFSGLPLGLLLGGVLSGMLGWRGAFAVMAVPGVAVALACWRLREPRRGLGDELDRLAAERGIAVVETPDGLDADTRPPTGDQLRALWAVPTLRNLFVGMPVLFFGIGGLFYWLPSFLERVYGFSEEAAGAVAGGGGFAGIVAGIVVGARLGDRHHRVRPGWRVRLGGLGLIGGAAAFAAALAAPAAGLSVAMVVVANFGFAVAIPNLTAAVADVVEAGDRGMGFAALQFLLTLGGAAGPAIVGVTSDATGSLRLGLWSLVVPMVAGALVVLLGGARYERDLAGA